MRYYSYSAHILITTGSTNMPFISKRLQLLAMTIDKSQDKNFDKVGLFLTHKETIFTYEQLLFLLDFQKSSENQD